MRHGLAQLGWRRLWASALACLLLHSLVLAVVSGCVPTLSVLGVQGAQPSWVERQLPGAALAPVAAAEAEPPSLPTEPPLPTATLLPTEPPPTPTPLPTEPPPTPTPLPTEPPPTPTPLPTEPPPTPLPTEPPPTPLPTEPPPPTEAPPVQATEPAADPPTRIQAAAVGLDVPVVEMGYKVVNVGGVQAMSWAVPDHAAGFHQGSALPGHVGNTVISGHSNAAGKVFLRLVDLEVGDRVTVHVGAEAYLYQVTQREMVQEEGVSLEQRIQNAQWILPTADERLTLVTCWPYTGASQRLILVARPAG